MLRRPLLLICLALLVLSLLLAYWWWDASADTEVQRQVPLAAAAAVAGETTAPLAQVTKGLVARAAATSAPPTAQEEAFKLWPHLREAGPSPAQLAQVHAQWSQLAQMYPDNLYLPSQYLAPKSAQQVRVARERLDDSSAMEAEMATLRQAYRYGGADQVPSPPPSLDSLSPQDIAMRRNYFDTRIHQLESLVQLVDFWFAKDAPNATDRATAEKEREQWTSELETMRGVRAVLPAQ